ncbi:MAG: bifunctional phosphoribosylaminoimidazolecarboxamide formyltransferase/IMP cyclohydrolase, partial [Planctomycetia bacterium]
VELLSTGGTRRALGDAGLAVVEVGAYTGFPEMMDGRVKTLHPKIHGGLLFRRDEERHVAAAAAHGIPPIDLVVVNLYPFEATVAQADVAFEEAVEQIDIGGPSLIRGGAKNHAHVAVVTDPSQYDAVLAELDRSGGSLSYETRRRLAAAAFARTAAYDAAISAYFAMVVAGDSAEDKSADLEFPPVLRTMFRRKRTLRYGENPQQSAAVYTVDGWPAAAVAHAEPLHGKELSYNNLLDLDAALNMAREFDRPAVIVVKHNNPCGAAVADTISAAFTKAWDADPLSAFGSVLGFNRPVDVATAEALAEPGRFVEAIVAPSFEPDAVTILTTKPTWKNSVRLLAVGDLTVGEDARRTSWELRSIDGGLLVQAADRGPNGFAEATVATRRTPTEAESADLAFAWTICKHVKSNAIVLAKDGVVVGVGAGQMSRVDSVKIALGKAGERAKGSVLASDAFFPFRDNIDAAAPAGVTAIVQPGGSKRDADSIAACDEHGLAMLFAGRRHFKH